MTNKEKFRDVLEDFALAQLSWGLNKIGEPIPTYINLCTTILNNYERLEWLNQEYKEPVPEVDWSKVKVDTPIYVRDREGDYWIKRHFAKYEDGLVSAWHCGQTSRTSDVAISWDYAKLAESEE